MKKIILLVFIAAISFGKIEAQVNVSDSLALVDLYNKCGPISDWNLSQPVSTWHGITITNSRVTGIYNPGVLQGHLPSSIGNLTALTSLNLEGNSKLIGKIPASIGNLYNLQSLWLANDRLSGDLPASLGDLSNLTELILAGNNLSGNIPSSFIKLSNISELNLGQNQLTGSIYLLSKLKTLTLLELAQNMFSDTLPSSIGNIPNLQTITLSSNRFVGSIPASYSKLGVLNLNNNQLSGDIPKSFKNLSEVYIQNNRFNFDGLEFLQETFGNSHCGYSPQTSIPLHQNKKKLSVSAGGTLSNETFKLYKNGALLKTQTADSVFTSTGSGSYYILITNSVATQLILSSDTIVIGGFAAKEMINNISNSFLNLYPNPAKDILNISLSASQNEKAQVQIIDVNGKILFNQSIDLSSGTSTQTINVSKLAKGNYFINIKTEEGSRSEKFVKE